MALYTGRLLMRGGNEADFDPDKMIPREWGVSTDKGIVRICIKPGVCIRMATYEAFEEDMAKIEEILKECQSIQEAVIRINTEVNKNADAVAEYTAQAKQYRDEAKQFRDEAFSTTPDGYAEVVKTVAKNTVKIDTVIEKADLGIKETASGEEIHLTDSAEGKAVEFALYGKATQDGEPTPENPQPIEVSGESYNLLENTATSQTINGVEFVVNEDGSVTVNGTATEKAYINILGEFNNRVQNETLKTEITLNGGYNSDCHVIAYPFINGEYDGSYALQSNGSDVTKDWTNVEQYYVDIVVNKGATIENATLYPMIRKASVKNDRYMPYGKGSVEVKSVGKNLFDVNGNKISSTVTNIVVDSNTSSVTGYSNGNMWSAVLFPLKLNDFVGKQITVSWKNDNTNQYKVRLRYKLDGEIYYTQTVNVTEEFEELGVHLGFDESGSTVKPFSFTFENIQIEYGTVASVFKSYKETLSTIPTENGLAGIKVASGGNYTDQNGQQWICDEVVKYSDGSGEYIQRVNKINLSEVEWLKHPSLNETYYADDIRDILQKNVYGDIVSTDGICSHFIYTENIKNVINGRKDNHITTYYDKGLKDYRTFVYSPLFTDLDSFNNFIEEKGVCLYYACEPITTPLTAEEIAEIEKLHTFYPITNISNDFDCGMKVKYNCDSKNYIDNKIALLTTAVVNSI